MTSPVRIDCNLDTVLWFAANRLIELGVLTSTTCVIGQNPDENYVPPSTNYAICSGRQQNQVSAETRTWSGVVTVRTYVMSGVDVAGRDYFNMTQSAGNGIQSFNNRVISALDLWDMNNGAFYFLAQPMRLSNQDTAIRVNEKTIAGQKWSYCDIVFDVLYGYDPTYVSPNVNSIHEYSYEYDGSFD